MKRTITLLLLLPALFISCAPGISVVIANNSKTDKTIKVAYPEHYRLPMDIDYRSTDSLVTYKLGEFYMTSRDRVLSQIRIPIESLDTLNRTYSFHLKAGHKAIVESRWPAAYPTYGQVFIINQTDTVQLIKRGKVFKKQPKLLSGGAWTYTINDPLQ